MSIISILLSLKSECHMDPTSIHMVEVEDKDMAEERPSSGSWRWRVRIWQRSAYRSSEQRWRIQ
jgi:hypothetical protein